MIHEKGKIEEYEDKELMLIYRWVRDHLWDMSKSELDILASLYREGELTVTQTSEKTGLSMSWTSKLLKILCKMHFVNRRVVNRERYYRLDDDIRHMMDLLNKGSSDVCSAVIGAVAAGTMMMIKEWLISDLKDKVLRLIIDEEVKRDMDNAFMYAVDEITKGVSKLLQEG
jgi:DNA-binding MarR family transcriptional regulator